MADAAPRLTTRSVCICGRIGRVLAVSKKRSRMNSREEGKRLSDAGSGVHAAALSCGRARPEVIHPAALVPRVPSLYGLVNEPVPKEVPNGCLCRDRDAAREPVELSAEPGAHEALPALSSSLVVWTKQK
jgi:hypothetical protein